MDKKKEKDIMDVMADMVNMADMEDMEDMVNMADMVDMDIMEVTANLDIMVTRVTTPTVEVSSSGLVSLPSISGT